MAYPWLRLWNSMLASDKVQMLTPEDFRAWVNLLVVANQGKPRGTLPAVERIAFHLRIDLASAKATMQRLSAVELIDEIDGIFSPHDWDEWQAGGDNSNERVKRYRDKIRSNGETATGYMKHRDEVYGRDNRTCVYCGGKENLCLDHLVPVNRGGLGVAANLVTACKRCNSGKAGRLPDEVGYTFHARHVEAIYRDACSAYLSLPVTVTANKPVTVTVTPDCHDLLRPITPLELDSDSDCVVCKEHITQSTSNSDHRNRDVTDHRNRDVTDQESPSLPAFLDTLAEDVDQAWPTANWGPKVYEFSKSFDPKSVEYGFRSCIEKSWKGEKITLARVRGLIEYAHANGCSLDEQIGGGARDPRPKPNGRAPTKKQGWREDVSDHGKALKARLAQMGGDDDDEANA